MIPPNSVGTGTAAHAVRLSPFALYISLIVDSRRKPRFQEVELELKTGKPDRLYHLALDLLRAVPKRISSLSKGERGYNLISPMSYSATRAQPLVLRKKDTVEAAFECIVQNCLAQIQGNELGVVKSDDAEPVHQMRVGIRRLRSALDLVEPLLVFPVSLEAELKWIAGKLGAARDWEVLATSTLSGTFGDAHRDFDAQAMISPVQSNDLSL
jgi:inorganic triphosphatase YgiF